MTSLHDYQGKAALHLRKHGRAGLFLDMGLGKTAIVLSAIEPRHLPVLVVAPKRVAEYVWPAERDKWRADLSMAVAAGSPAKRAAALTSGADIVVIGRDNLKDVPPGRFTTVVLDELSGFKSRATLRWKLARKICAQADYVWGLTGTPTPNGLIDLWAQLALLDKGQRLGTTIGSYRDRYFHPGYTLPNGIVTEWRLKPGADAAIHRLIDDICLSMSARDHLDLPPVTYNEISVPLSASAKRVYADMVDDLVADIGLLGDITAANAAVLSGKLSQITAGFLYDEWGQAHDLHDAKIEAVKEVIEGTGSPVLIFYRFKHELARLRELPGAMHVDEPNAMDLWNHGKVPVLLAHPASAGHGLNLQHGGHTIIWTTLPWSLEEHMQANGRLDRQGQSEVVVVHYLLVPGSIDHEILSVLRGKKTVQDALLDHLKK